MSAATAQKRCVIFPDGSMACADTWAALELELREDSWNPSAREAFRAEMAKRAWAWSRTPVVTDYSARELFESLEAAGILRIVLEEDAS